jgi:N-methylhydantoinase B/oxoprolinase/acetone carboxylase alpha subunit
MFEGSMVGGSAGHDRDGYDLFSFMAARKAIIESIDIEVFEQRYPVLVTSSQRPLRSRTEPSYLRGLAVLDCCSDK